MLFDLSSCVTQTGGGAVCTPLNCAQQGYTCGEAGDGCGNIIPVRDLRRWHLHGHPGHLRDLGLSAADLR